MKIVVHGKVLAPDGFAQQVSLVQGRDRPELRRRSWATRPEELRDRQPCSKLSLEHEQPFGQVVALERDHAGLWATCEAEASANRLVQFSSGDWFYSPEIDALVEGCDRTDVVLTGLALVRKPAQLGLGPVAILDGELQPSAIDNRWHHLPKPTRVRLHRAVEQLRHRDRSALTVIDERTRELDHLVGRSADSLTPGDWAALEDQAWRHRPLRHGTGGRVLNVR